MGADEYSVGLNSRLMEKSSWIPIIDTHIHMATFVLLITSQYYMMPPSSTSLRGDNLGIVCCLLYSTTLTSPSSTLLGSEVTRRHIRHSISRLVTKKMPLYALFANSSSLVFYLNRSFHNYWSQFRQLAHKQLYKYDFTWLKRDGLPRTNSAIYLNTRSFT